MIFVLTLQSPPGDMLYRWENTPTSMIISVLCIPALYHDMFGTSTESAAAIASIFGSLDGLTFFGLGEYHITPERRRQSLSAVEFRVI
jgi:hypothetical protein